MATARNGRIGFREVEAAEKLWPGMKKTVSEVQLLEYKP